MATGECLTKHFYIRESGVQTAAQGVPVAFWELLPLPDVLLAP